MTHAARALQSHDLSGEWIKLWITYIYFFDHTRTWRASPDEWSTQCWGHLRDSTNMKDNTHQAHTQSSQQGEYGMMITTAKWYSGILGDLKFPDICLTGEEELRKNLSRPGIEPGPAAWQARMLPLAPERWTVVHCTSPYSLRGAMGEISNFYNFSRRLFIFATHISPIISIHATKFHCFL